MAIDQKLCIAHSTAEREFTEFCKRTRNLWAIDEERGVVDKHGPLYLGFMDKFHERKRKIMTDFRKQIEYDTSYYG